MKVNILDFSHKSARDMARYFTSKRQVISRLTNVISDHSRESSEVWGFIQWPALILFTVDVVGYILLYFTPYISEHVHHV